MKKTFAIITAALALLACKKDNTLRYNNITMGDVIEQTIVSDQGNTFDIVDPADGVDLSGHERVMVICDVLKQTGENRYDIRLNYIYPVLRKAVVTASEIADKAELQVEDAINIREIWYGGGYLNMLIELAQKDDSETRHRITLVQDDSAEGYAFILRHNAYGEVPSEDDLGYAASLGYVSFPVADLFKGDETTFSLSWKSHKMMPDGRFIMLETEDMNREYKWKRIGYEHQMPAVQQSAGFRAR